MPVDPTQPGAPATAVVVEGDPALLRVISRLLTLAGISVQSVLSEADFETALRTAPDLVISGLRMPGHGGVEVLEFAKRVSPNSMRCLLSGSLFALTGADLESLRPLYTIAKPFDGPELVRDVLSAWAAHASRLRG